MESSLRLTPGAGDGGRLTVEEALRRAQLAVMAPAEVRGARRDVTVKSPEAEASARGLAHPFYWAGVVLIGDGR